MGERSERGDASPNTRDVRTHAGIRLRIKSHLPSWRVLVPTCPARIPTAKIVDKEQGGEKERSKKWLDCEKEAATQPRQNETKKRSCATAKAIKDLVEKTGAGRETEKITKKYASWIAVLERFSLKEAGLDPDSKEARKYKGRGSIPTLKQRKLQDKKLAEHEFYLSAGFGVVARSIAVMGEALKKVASFALSASARTRESGSHAAEPGEPETREQ